MSILYNIRAKIKFLFLPMGGIYCFHGYDTVNDTFSDDSGSSLEIVLGTTVIIFSNRVYDDYMFVRVCEIASLRIISFYSHNMIYAGWTRVFMLSIRARIIYTAKIDRRISNSYFYSLSSSFLCSQSIDGMYVGTFQDWKVTRDTNLSLVYS